jgi:hypothetical protein
VLDTCHAGQLVTNLMGRSEVPSSTKRVIERMKDRTGLWVLAGAAADAPSYEATRYAQGLLTHALLRGMQGAALRAGEYVDVATLYEYAVDEVPRLAKGIGGVQRPLIAVSGSPFDIGVLNEARRARIHVAEPLPLVERSSLQDEQEMDDTLELGKALDAALRERAERRSPSLVFVDGVGMPDASRVAGRYRRLADGSIKVTLRVLHEHTRARTRVVQGRADALDALVRSIADAVTKNLPKAAAGASRGGI